MNELKNFWSFINISFAIKDPVIKLEIVITVIEFLFIIFGTMFDINTLFSIGCDNCG
jgi:hypothetical protein